MPPRGSAPGLKRGRHNLPYWIAKQVVRDPMGFPDLCIALPADASAEELAELCREHTARLHAWIDEAKHSGQPVQEPHYDGTVSSAVRYYQQHPHSDFHTIAQSTRRTYLASLRVLELTVGARVIRNVTVPVVKYWYKEWRKPEVWKDAAGNTIVGPERIDRAHDAVAMFKTVLRFLAAQRKQDCKRLADELHLVRFEKGGAREQEMSYSQTAAYIRKAFELRDRGLMSAERALSMSIGAAAQFDLLLRQKDVIGEYAATEKDAQRAMRKVVPVRIGKDWWVGQFTWENIAAWRWRVRTSKSKYRSAIEFDLTRYSLLFPLLQLVPHEDRRGPIVVEKRLPMRARSYRKWFRQIARAAGIPDDVWLMDTRAGGITEAEEAGVDLEFLKDAATHAEKGMTLRYVRRRSKRIAVVADARMKAREAGQ